MLRIGLVGAWHVHFDQYASELASREDCCITALWDDDVARGRAAAQKYGCAFEPDYDVFLERKDVDGVVVASATSLHPTLLIEAAKAGKHIYTEKVLTISYADALQVREAVIESGVKFCISFPFRCQAEYLYAKQAVTQGLLGDITYARVRDAHSGAVDGWLPEYFYNANVCGGGAMIDLGAHPMYLLYDLFGKPDTVMSFFKCVTGRAVEDSALSVLEFGNLVACSETGFVSANNPFSLELSGTKGFLYWGGIDGTLSVNTGSGFFHPELPEPLKRPTDLWADGVLYDVEIPFGIDDAVALTQMMDYAYQSAETGKKVKFPA